MYRVRSRASRHWEAGASSLQIDSDAVMASDHVRVRGVTFSSDLNLDNVERLVFSGFAKFNEFDGQWMVSRQRHLYMLSSRPEWTTAAWFLPAHSSL